MAKRSGTARQTLDDRIIFDLPTTVDSNFSSALRTVLVEATTASWEFWLRLLEEYLFENENSWPKGKETYNGHHIGSWLHNQLNDYRNNHLSIEKIQTLEKLNIVWEPREEQYQYGLRQFKKRSEALKNQTIQKIMWMRMVLA